MGKKEEYDGRVVGKSKRVAGWRGKRGGGYSNMGRARGKRELSSPL